MGSSWLGGAVLVGVPGLLAGIVGSWFLSGETIVLVNGVLYFVLLALLIVGIWRRGYPTATGEFKLLAGVTLAFQLLSWTVLGAHKGVGLPMVALILSSCLPWGFLGVVVLGERYAMGQVTIVATTFLSLVPIFGRDFFSSPWLLTVLLILTTGAYLWASTGPSTGGRRRHARKWYRRGYVDGVDDARRLGRKKRRGPRLKR